ncbi:hypothetical protein DMUE_3756 [Dictyocoela muelleri]|nr:hypothetical protein DMUE_3756 [Dictyocoela muelleri]
MTQSAVRDKQAETNRIAKSYTLTVMFIRSVSNSSKVRRNNMFVLSQIISLNTLLQIDLSLNSSDKISKIFKLKYNKNTAHEYQQKLMEIKQCDFHTIRAYIYEIIASVQEF